MKKTFVCCLLAALGFATQVQAAPITWTLQGALFDDGTVATGSFVYDADTNIYSNWSIDVDPGTLSAFVYDPTNSAPNPVNMDATGILFILNNFSRYINFNFEAPLTNAGGTIQFDLPWDGTGFEPGAWECDNCNVVRFFTEGAVTTVPEPATFFLVGFGTASVATYRRRRGIQK